MHAFGVYNADIGVAIFDVPDSSEGDGNDNDNDVNGNDDKINDDLLTF